MQSKTITKFKVFWAWQDEREEAWLTEMASQGWHLKELSFPMVYTFEAGPPRHMAYRLDFFIDHKDFQTYLQLFRDAGWEYVGRMGSWQYFRIQAEEGQEPEIYTDPASKIQKYRRLIAFLVVFLPIYLLLSSDVLLRGNSLPIILIKMVWILIMILYIIAMLKLIQRMNQLKHLSDQRG